MARKLQSVKRDRFDLSKREGRGAHGSFGQGKVKHQSGGRAPDISTATTPEGNQVPFLGHAQSASMMATPEYSAARTRAVRGVKRHR